jgi:predicted nucleic acid-binding Zn ribbon protein
MDGSRQLDNPAVVRAGAKLDGRGVRQRRRTTSGEAARLGDVLSELVEGQILPRHIKFESIAELWCQLLPMELRRHCKIADISGGQLKVVADSPSYANKLRWCSSQLLEELRQRCRRGRIKRIKITVG